MIPYPPEVPDCLERKLRSLRKVLAMTESLRDRLNVQDIREAEKLLDQRQGVIYEIDSIDDQIREIGSGRSLAQIQFPIGQKIKILSLLSHIEEILEKARTLDKQCSDSMTSWRNDVKNQLLNTRESLKVVHGYAGKPVRQPRFLDVKR